MHGAVGRAVEVAQFAGVEPVLEEVEQGEVDAVHRGVAAELRDPPVQGPVQGEVCVRVVGPALHLIDDPVEGGEVLGVVVRGRVAADHRLDRVAHDEAVGIARRAPGRPEAAEREGHADGRVGDEDAAAGAGAGLDEATHLEQAHGLVDRRDRDAEALAQVVLRADPLAGRQPVAEDLDLEVACDRLRARNARRGRAVGLLGGRHRDGSYGRGGTRRAASSRWTVYMTDWS